MVLALLGDSTTTSRTPPSRARRCCASGHQRSRSPYIYAHSTAPTSTDRSRPAGRCAEAGPLSEPLADPPRHGRSGAGCHNHRCSRAVPHLPASSRCVTDPAGRPENSQLAHRPTRWWSMTVTQCTMAASQSAGQCPSAGTCRQVPPAAECRSSRRAGSTADNRRYARPGRRRGCRAASRPGRPRRSRRRGARGCPGRAGPGPAGNPMLAGRPAAIVQHRRKPA